MAEADYQETGADEQLSLENLKQKAIERIAEIDASIKNMKSIKATKTSELGRNGFQRIIDRLTTRRVLLEHLSSVVEAENIDLEEITIIAKSLDPKTTPEILDEKLVKFIGEVGDSDVAKRIASLFPSNIRIYGLQPGDGQLQPNTGQGNQYVPEIVNEAYFKNFLTILTALGVVVTDENGQTIFAENENENVKYRMGVNDDTRMRKEPYLMVVITNKHGTFAILESFVPGNRGFVIDLEKWIAGNGSTINIGNIGDLDSIYKALMVENKENLIEQTGVFSFKHSVSGKYIDRVVEMIQNGSIPEQGRVNNMRTIETETRETSSKLRKPTQAEKANNPDLSSFLVHEDDGSVWITINTLWKNPKLFSSPIALKALKTLANENHLESIIVESTTYYPIKPMIDLVEKAMIKIDEHGAVTIDDVEYVHPETYLKAIEDSSLNPLINLKKIIINYEKIVKKVFNSNNQNRRTYVYPKHILDTLIKVVVISKVFRCKYNEETRDLDVYLTIPGIASYLIHNGHETSRFTLYSFIERNHSITRDLQKLSTESFTLYSLKDFLAIPIIASNVIPFTSYIHFPNLHYRARDNTVWGELVSIINLLQSLCRKYGIDITEDRLKHSSPYYHLVVSQKDGLIEIESYFDTKIFPAKSILNSQYVKDILGNQNISFEIDENGKFYVVNGGKI